MAKKEFTYRGKHLEELKAMSLQEFAELLPSRQRRKIDRGFTDAEKIFLEKFRKKGTVETHCRDMLVLPEMVNKTIRIHNGKKFIELIVQPHMLGHCFGEFVLTRNRVAHSAPGVGATRSSSAISVR
ncbi:MAG: 30S ribosomal protein S19 [DPANN group archaeon]|nr:30S ribosomal protein S19 [DPANN group archaeon]